MLSIIIIQKNELHILKRVIAGKISIRAGRKLTKYIQIKWGGVFFVWNRKHENRRGGWLYVFGINFVLPNLEILYKSSDQ